MAKVLGQIHIQDVNAHMAWICQEVPAESFHIAFQSFYLNPNKGLYLSSAVSVLSSLTACVVYGFLVNNSLMLFLLSDRFVTPS